MSSDGLDRIGICLLNEKFLVMDFVKTYVIFGKMMRGVIPGGYHFMKRAFGEFSRTVGWKGKLMF